jgi:general secretion pathway protein I
MNNANDRGFSLLEVIVAVALLGIGFMTIVQLFSESIRSVSLSDQYLKGTALANLQLSKLEITDFMVDPPAGTFENDENYRWELFWEPYESPLNRVLEDIRVYKTTLRVSWQDAGKERDLQIVTLRTLARSYPTTDSVAQGGSKKGSTGGGKDMGGLGLPTSSGGGTSSGVGTTESGGGGGGGGMIGTPGQVTTPPQNISGGVTGSTSHISGSP